MMTREFPEVNAPILCQPIDEPGPVSGTVWVRGTFDGGPFNDGISRVRILYFALYNGRRIGAGQCLWWHEVRA